MTKHVDVWDQNFVWFQLWEKLSPAVNLCCREGGGCLVNTILIYLSLYHLHRD